MPRIALLSIKPNFANQILFGTKRFEYRKKPVSDDTTHILIYMTFPVKRIVGIASIKHIHSGASSSLWEKTKFAAGITRKFYRSYFQNTKKAYAYELDDVIPFNTWIDPLMIESTFKAPQSFKYINDDFLSQVIQISGTTFP